MRNRRGRRGRDFRYAARIRQRLGELTGPARSQAAPLRQSAKRTSSPHPPLRRLHRSAGPASTHDERQASRGERHYADLYHVAGRLAYGPRWRDMGDSERIRFRSPHLTCNQRRHPMGQRAVDRAGLGCERAAVPQGRAVGDTSARPVRRCYGPPRGACTDLQHTRPHCGAAARGRRGVGRPVGMVSDDALARLPTMMSSRRTL
jgi:hypothetical protein